jgi:membrane protease YdiL (CAAX protease family)
MTMGSDTTAPTPGAPPALRPDRGPWGLWASLGLSAVVFVVYVLMTAVVVVGYSVYRQLADPGAAPPDYENILGTSGLLVCLAIIAAGLSGTLMVLWFTRLRKSYSVREYLCLRFADRKSTLIWFAILISFILLYHGLAYLVEFQNVGDLYMGIYDSVVFPPVFFLALVVVPPIFEESLFRGFLFRGIQASRLGNVGAVLITSITWAVVHAQYEAGLIAVVFLIGILLGVARARSGSLYLTMMLHGAFNLISVSELILFNAAS